MPAEHARLKLHEVFGLAPLPLRAREAWLAIRGDAHVPPSRVDLTTLDVLQPALSVRTWLGHRRADRRVPIYNLFNRTPTPPEAGWSIRKTQVRDFRGGTLTYDSHNGTDFVLPLGTVVVAPAPARVLRVSSELNRGGLKVFLDHGRGLVTTSNHLARALVRPGDLVARGEPIALSGYSGLDALLAFPWSVPHVHFNVWLDGEYTDPFAEPGEASIWRDGNEPRPSPGDGPREPFEPTEWDEAGVAAAIDACEDAAIRAELAREPDLGRRAMSLLFQRNYYPTRFRERPPVVRGTHAREPRLTLPVRAGEWEGLAL
jgi:murein DD-endopeptidase MepM/ murein hydrolase activator NlpD